MPPRVILYAGVDYTLVDKSIDKRQIIEVDAITYEIVKRFTDTCKIWLDRLVSDSVWYTGYRESIVNMFYKNLKENRKGITKADIEESLYMLGY